MPLTSIFRASVHLVLAGAAAVLLTACADGPADPLAGPVEPAPLDHHKPDHANGGGAASITVLQQPDVQPNPGVEDFCNFPYSFEVDAKGPEREVRWAVYWVGGEHDGGPNIGSNTITVGARIGGVVASPTPAHPNDGHSFDALRIEVLDGTSLTSPVLASVLTEGRTIDC